MTSVTCLLPVRNGAADLPGWLESAGRFADSVVALDDGSTDSTAEILASHSLVERLLTNPPREGYEGWDDAENRRRLLEAAGETDPDWIVWLDADERIDRGDAAALREFLETDALPGCAYGFELHRMWGDERCFSNYSWVYRCFAFAPAQELPERTLHFNPIPTSIPRPAWLRTSIRVRHLDSPQRMEERRNKYEAVDPTGELAPATEWLMEEPDPGQLLRWTERDPGLAPLDPDRQTTRSLGESHRPRPAEAAPRPRIACLLPVRNGADDLPGWFESVERFASDVIALDDGSTDDTGEILDSHPGVSRTLTNPQREGYEGWDDAENRQRLLDAAAEIKPDWILWLDADERIDEGDAEALQRLCAEFGQPGRAYGMRVFRMAGDDQHFDRAGFWAYRLFAYESSLRLPEARLHALPVPDSIPPDRFVRTTIRIKHLAAISPERKAERLAKYRSADPDGEFQADYSNLLEDGATIERWMPRRPEMPLLAGLGREGSDADLDLHTLDLDGPALSAVIIAQHNAETIEGSVRAVLDQDVPGGHETIVVVSGSPETAAVVRDRTPEAQLIEIEEPVLPGAARNAGLRVARGDYISFPGSHVVIAPGSLERRLAAHELGYPMVTGVTINGTHTRAGWAAYLLDHAFSMPARPSGELSGPPGHCSYARDFLVAVGGFPEDLRAGEDTVVNTKLFERGHRAYRAQDLVFTHTNRCDTLPRLLRHHFGRGRAMSMILRDRHPGGRIRLSWKIRKAFGPTYVPSRISKTFEAVEKWGDPDHDRDLKAARPFVALGVLAAWLGIWWEIASPSRPES